MKSTIKKILRYFEGLVSGVNALACVVTMLLMVIIVTDVCSRYFFNKPINGVAEIVTLAIVLIAFFQIPLVQMHDRHLKSTVFYDKMGPKMKLAVDFVGLVLGVVVFILICKSGWSYFVKAIVSSEFEGGAVKIPVWPARLSIVIGSVLMIIIQLRQIIEKTIDTFCKKDASSSTDAAEEGGAEI